MVRAVGGTLTEAAGVGAAAGGAFSSGERHNAMHAEVQALVGAGITNLPAIGSGINCLNAIIHAVGAGLFNVSYHDRLMAPAAGTQNVTHTG